MRLIAFGQFSLGVLAGGQLSAGVAWSSGIGGWHRRRSFPFASTCAALTPMDANDLELIHTRGYDVRGYWRPDGTLLIRGAVRDELPPGFYDIDDDEPLVMHHMVVELSIELPGLVITAVHVEFKAHPHEACPNVIDRYDRLVGLAIARGFTHKVRELFGGPRGCTHTTALLQAMAPVAQQCRLASMTIGHRRARDEEGQVPSPALSSQAMRERRAAGNHNTCHVWAEDGEHIARIVDGSASELPIPISVRIRERGGDPDEWRRQRWD